MSAKPKNATNRTSGSDITMCKGGGCPFKEMCHRYTALPDELYQSYFVKPPFKITKGKPSCEMFYGEAADNLFIMLKEIMSDKKVLVRKPLVKAKPLKARSKNASLRRKRG